MKLKIYMAESSYNVLDAIGAAIAKGDFHLYRRIAKILVSLGEIIRATSRAREVLVMGYAFTEHDKPQVPKDKLKEFTEEMYKYLEGDEDIECSPVSLDEIIAAGYTPRPSELAVLNWLLEESAVTIEESKDGAR